MGGDGFLYFVLAFAGLLGSVLLYNQNQLLEKQNEKIDNQIELEESSRRGNLIVMMSNIMDKVDEELEKDWNKDSIRNLSPQLLGRIIALSLSFKPYRFWHNGKLIEKPLSPEKGQLLVALLNSKLDYHTNQSIFRKGNFENSYLENAVFPDFNLMYINLQNSYMAKTTIGNTMLSFANLSNVDLRHSTFFKGDISSANIEGIKVSNKTWIENLNYSATGGFEDIVEKWVVDTTLKKDLYGDYYTIKKR